MNEYVQQQAFSNLVRNSLVRNLAITFWYSENCHVIYIPMSASNSSPSPPSNAYIAFE